ncbi:MAG: geranylgeranyl reductase family protein [Chloroflexota bacterium]
MKPLDVVVIGAGPAGSTAARLLAEEGARVRLLEARRLPRPKLCAGGLSPKAQALLPPSALAVVERRVERVGIRHRFVRSISFDYPEAGIALVERAPFDYALAEAASRAGAEVLDAEPVRDVTGDGLGAWVVTDHGRFRADTVVLADGEPSVLARSVGLGWPPRRRSLALALDVPLAPAVATDSAILSFNIPGGFSWYFPKGDHASVGIGSHRELGAAALRAGLERFARSIGIEPLSGRIAGHWIPHGLRRGPMASSRIILAGDAAATTDPLFWEGISYALMSGAAAARTIEAWANQRIPDLRPYDERLHQLLGPAFGRLGLVARAAEVSITLALLALRFSPSARAAAIDAIAGRRAPYNFDSDCSLACVCRLPFEPHPALATRSASGGHGVGFALIETGCDSSSRCGTRDKDAVGQVVAGS